MKKKGFMLSVFFILCACLLTVNVNAASGIIFGSTDKNFTSTTLSSDETASTGSISVENKGANSTLVIGIKATSAISIGTELTAEIKMGNSSYDFKSCSRISGSGWDVTCKESTTDSDVIIMSLKSTAQMTAGQKVAISTVTLDGTNATSTDPCTITIAKKDTPVVENPKCQVKDEKYYCANGTECTETEYKSQCETTENPQTGSFLPYAVIAGGLVLAIGLYVSTKKNKIYHI